MHLNTVIQVQDLSKSYKLYDRSLDRLKESLHPFRKKYHRDFFALNSVSFEVTKGESLGIIGKNGSGKSTLLKILTGVLTPTSGTVTVQGKVASLLELGAGFNFEMTGIENIYFNGTLMGYSKKEMDSKLEAILDFADIGDFVHQPVKTYSSGMFVRLAFAAAISVDPDIFIVDEALSVGDVFFQQKCHARMETLSQQGATIIVVSHDMTSIAKYSSKVLFLDHGAIVFSGEPVEAVHRYYSSLLSKPVVSACVETRRPELDDTHDKSVISGLNELDEQQHADEAGERLIEGWPSENAFIDVSTATVIGGEQIIRCNKLAVCNQRGMPTSSFETGETASFFMEFTMLQDIGVPMAGVEIINNKNILLYSRSSMHFLLEAPTQLRKGDRIRFRHSVKLDLFPGEYTFVICFSTMNSEDYRHVADMSPGLLQTKVNPLTRISRIQKIEIRERHSGIKQPFNGLVKLEGEVACELVNARSQG